MARIKLDKISTRAPEHLDKDKTKAITANLLSELDELQNRMYAESKHSVLVILQGMDASGKDGTIRKVFGTMNPQGVAVSSFKVPTQEELAHDFLWRIHRQVPQKGMIKIFNRSHYEDILVTRVHKWCNDAQAKQRMRAINDFENLLTTHNQTHILKFYLHISKEEQKKRLEERISNREKQWKYNDQDLTESKLWDLYRKMYEDCFTHCDEVPWTVVPADQNWYKEHIVAKALHDLLKGLNMQYPGIKK